MKIKNHWIEEADRTHRSPNKSRGKMKPTIIVLHYTGSGGKDGSGDASYLSRASTRASAQLVIGREGDIHQLMGLNEKAWHAGKSKYNGKANLNHWTIGIEIDNWGWLDGRGINLPEDQIHHETRFNLKTWEKYKPAQLATVEEAIAAICEYYDIEDIVGHEEICVPYGRKQDPGPALDDFMAEMKEKYIGKEASNPPVKETHVEEGWATVNVNNLRLRKTASYQAPILTHMPKNSVVKILGEPFPGWFKVQFGERVGFTVWKYLEFPS